MVAMLEKKIVNLFERVIGDGIICINDIPSGTDQLVKSIKTIKSKYVIKVPRKKIIVFREKFAFGKLHGLLPIPKIIYATDQFLIQEFIEGEDLNKIHIDDEEEGKIYYQLGQELSKLHKIGSAGFGFIGYDGKGEYDSLRKKILTEFEEIFEHYKNLELLSSIEIRNVYNYLARNENFLNSTESVLLHFDFEAWNVKVMNGRVTGILDFGDLSSGPKAYDIARPYISLHEKQSFKYFINGYGKVNLDEVKFFAFCHLSWMIIYSYFTNSRDELESQLKLLKEIVSI